MGFVESPKHTNNQRESPEHTYILHHYLLLKVVYIDYNATYLYSFEAHIKLNQMGSCSSCSDEQKY